MAKKLHSRSRITRKVRRGGMARRRELAQVKTEFFQDRRVLILSLSPSPSLRASLSPSPRVRKTI